MPHGHRPKQKLPLIGEVWAVRFKPALLLMFVAHCTMKGVNQLSVMPYGTLVDLHVVSPTTWVPPSAALLMPWCRIATQQTCPAPPTSHGRLPLPRSRPPVPTPPATLAGSTERKPSRETSVTPRSQP